MKIRVFWKEGMHVHKHTQAKYYISSGWEDSHMFYSLQSLKQTEVGK